jgi:hypothetical protein
VFSSFCIDVSRSLQGIKIENDVISYKTLIGKGSKQEG